MERCDFTTPEEAVTAAASGPIRSPDTDPTARGTPPQNERARARRGPFLDVVL
jgi:hypothetical protein